MYMKKMAYFCERNFEALKGFPFRRETQSINY